MLYDNKGKTFCKQHLENVFGMFLRPQMTDDRTILENIINPCLGLGKQAKLPQKIQCKPKQDQTHHNDIANPSRLPAVPGLMNWIGCRLQITLSATKQLMPDPCCLATGCSLLCSCPNGRQCHSDSYTQAQQAYL